MGTTARVSQLAPFLNRGGEITARAAAVNTLRTRRAHRACIGSRIWPPPQHAYDDRLQVTEAVTPYGTRRHSPRVHTDRNTKGRNPMETGLRPKLRGE